MLGHYQTFSFISLGKTPKCQSFMVSQREVFNPMTHRFTCAPNFASQFLFEHFKNFITSLEWKHLFLYTNILFFVFFRNWYLFSEDYIIVLHYIGSKVSTVLPVMQAFEHWLNIDDDEISFLRWIWKLTSRACVSVHQ